MKKYVTIADVPNDVPIRITKQLPEDKYYANINCDKCDKKLARLFWACDGCFINVEEFFNLCKECWQKDKNKHHLKSFDISQMPIE